MPPIVEVDWQFQVKDRLPVKRENLPLLCHEGDKVLARGDGEERPATVVEVRAKVAILRLHE